MPLLKRKVGVSTSQPDVRSWASITAPLREALESLPPERGRRSPLYPLAIWGRRRRLEGVER
jgi:hypothetical protein